MRRTAPVLLILLLLAGSPGLALTPRTSSASRSLSPRDIVDVAPNTRHHFAWYRDGTVSSGVSDHLDRYRKRYIYKVPNLPGHPLSDS